MSITLDFKEFDKSLRTAIEKHNSTYKPELTQLINAIPASQYAAHSEHPFSKEIISIEEFVGIYNLNYRSPYTLVMTNEPKLRLFRGVENRIKMIKRKFLGVVRIPGMADFICEYESSPALVIFNEKIKQEAIRRYQDFTKHYPYNKEKTSSYYFTKK